MFADADEEIGALIETIRVTEQRLDELTSGEVDALIDSSGRTFLLRRAQEQFRRKQIDKQAGILNALPAHVALLDARGTISTVNDAWREFARSNSPGGAPDPVGLNYLETCDASHADGLSEARPVADGIRAVLSGAAKSFSFEYPCHSPTRKRWFLLLVNPLVDERRNGVVIMHVDISEEKKTEERLRFSEHRFLQMAESINEVFFLIDVVSRQMLYVSPAYEQIWGRSTDSLYANPESWFDTIHADDRAAITRAFKEGLTEGAFCLECRIVRSNGAIRWIEVRAFPIYDHEGMYIRLAGIAADITSRKVSDFRLRRLNRLHHVLSKVGEIVLRTRERQALYNAACRILVDDGRLEGVFIAEVDPGTRLARHVASYRAGQDYPQGRTTLSADDEVLTVGTVGTVLRVGRHVFYNDIAAVARTKPWHTAALRKGLLASASFPLHLQGAVVGVLTVYSSEVDYFQEDELRLIVAVARDLSLALEALDVEQERIRAEREIRFNEQRYRSLVEATAAIVWDTPASGDFEVEQPRWTAFTGQSFEELRGKGWLDAIHPDDQAETARVWLAAVAGRTLYEVEHRLRTRDGTYRNMMVRAVPITTDDGMIVRWIGVHTDITEQRKVQEALRESEERYRALIDWSPEAISVQRDGKLIYVNPAAIKLAGATSARDLLGTSMMEMLHPDSQLVVDRSEYRIEAGVGDALVEQKLIALDGRVVDVEVQRTEIIYDGEPALYQSMRDISARKQAEAALKLSEFSVNNASAATFWIGQDASILRVNRAACEMLGYSEYELLAMRITDLNVGFSVEHWPLHWQSLRDRRRMSLESRYQRKDGHMLPVEIDLNWFEFEGREYDFASVRDITERKLAEERINYLNRVHAVLSGINTLIVRVRERDELFNEACRIAVEQGWFRLAMMGILDRSTMKLNTVVMHAADEPLRTAIQSILDASRGALTPMVLRAIDEKKAIVANDSQNDPQVSSGNRHVEFGVRSMVILPLIIADEVIGVFALYSNNAEFFHAAEMELLTELASDISFAIDHIARSERLNYLAYYDVLTGLANRSLFLERTAQFMRSAGSAGQKLAICLIDLERFKNINDTLGRTVGDTLLRQVAEWLTRNVGDANLLSRVDADHFAVVLPQVKHESEVARLLEKQRNAFLAHAFHLDDQVLRIAFKVGVAIFPDDGDDAETVFKNAEAALKRTKATGESHLFYTQKMSAAMSGKLTMENQLRQAVDHGEFVLHYQPKVTLADGTISGAEALIRWNDPRKGLVPPALFIPVLEETGLIHEVGRWALRTAITDFLRWRDIAPHRHRHALRIAVNVSPLQLKHRGFVAEIEQAISVDAHASGGLELEITESVIMEDVRHSIASLQAIRAMGVSVAIDDFGTGFSSLNYLSKLPVDTIKIDRSFVNEMTVGPAGLALVSTIINLSHAIKLKVVAEGVETEEQSRLLRLLGCDEMQGFLFSAPVPVDTFERKFLSLQSEKPTS